MATINNTSGNQGQDTHNRQEDQGNDEEEELEEIQMDTYDEEAPDETAEDAAKKHEFRISRIGQSYNFTIKAREVLKYERHPGCLGCKTHHW